MRLHENINFMQTCSSWISRVMTEEWELAINLRDKAMISMFEKLWSGDGEKSAGAVSDVMLQLCIDFTESIVKSKCFDAELPQLYRRCANFHSERSEISLWIRAKQQKLRLISESIEVVKFAVQWVQNVNCFAANLFLYEIRISILKPLKFSINCTANSTFPFPVMLRDRREFITLLCCLLMLFLCSVNIAKNPFMVIDMAEWFDSRKI